MANTAGRVDLITGCMFSNKTLTLITWVEKHRIAKKQCAIVKHAIDTRYDSRAQHGGIVCNNGMEYSSCPILTASRLSDIDVTPYDVIGVTESQFFDDLLVVDQWANAGKIVICDGLDGDSNREPFGQIHKLAPKCEGVIKLNAVCLYCGANAAFTRRITGSSDCIDVGGAEKYTAVCRQCYNL